MMEKVPINNDETRMLLMISQLLLMLLLKMEAIILWIKLEMSFETILG